MGAYKSGDTSGFSCGCMIVVIIINLVLGAWSVNYILPALGLDPVSTLPAVIIGMFAGEITIPLAIILWLVGIGR